MTVGEAYDAIKRGYLSTDNYNNDYRDLCIQRRCVEIQLIGENELRIDYTPCGVPIAKDYLTELVIPHLRPYLTDDSVVSIGPENKTVTVTRIQPSKAQECAEFAAIHQL